VAATRETFLGAKQMNPVVSHLILRVQDELRKCREREFTETMRLLTNAFSTKIIGS
jgi:hypothetical protein